MIDPGDLVTILPHHLEGYGWTVGAVGSIKSPAHERDFDVRSIPKHLRPQHTPPIKLGWWIVSVEQPKAKGGFAFAALPEKHLAPHACTERCPKHPCQAG